MVTSTPPSVVVVVVEEDLAAKSTEASSFWDRSSRFLCWLLLGFLVILFVDLLPDGAIGERMIELYAKI